MAALCESPLLFLTLLLGLIALPGEGLTHGCVKLDNYTFDKFLSLPGHSYFVKIDEPYSYGDKMEAHKTLCTLAHSVPNFFAAEVPVQEFNEKQNDDMRERFKLTREEFPVYFLFNEVERRGLRYTGAIQAANMISWLRSNGVMMPSIDTIDELDELAHSFMDAPDAAYLDKAKSAAEKYPNDKKAAWYAKIMDKILAKGKGYAAEEIARLMKLLGGKLVAPEKRDELGDKLKILKVFAKVQACDMFSCPEGHKKKFDAAGIVGSDKETCCRPPCQDMDDGEHDAQGHHCDYYDDARTVKECGDWDTGKFRANKICCACGGGDPG
eukprot:TRINITY_DN32061_c0_g1_i1.p1 TRINITY_DN32061_c0_g1~~TRINITY_DN32061_c0_g1_i1.p1  ORF type:complete len:325 (-),score=77.04 TRINITY_DN32061_c0_g1_i1:183-1157(-)